MNKEYHKTKEDKTMETRQKVSKDYLQNNGWKFLSNFAENDEIWGKDDKRLLWDTKTGEIWKIYTS